MANLAITWKASGRRNDAIELMNLYVILMTRIKGPEHERTREGTEILESWTGL